MGNPNHYEILEIITNWPEGKHFGLPSEEEEDWVSCTEEAPPHNQAPESERRHTLFTESSCHVIGTSKKLKAAILMSKQQLPKLPKEKVDQVRMQTWKPIWLWILPVERSGQNYTSILTCGWWQTLCMCGGGGVAEMVEKDQLALKKELCPCCKNLARHCW